MGYNDCTVSLLTETQLPNRLHKGKVRDTYDLNNGLLLMVATDRLSAFDVVLPTGIPNKGVILSKLSEFWFKNTTHLIPNHFIAMGQDVDLLKSHGIELSSWVPQDILERSMVVQQAQRIDIECVVRGYLSGSAWAEYQKTGTAGNIPLPKGLKESQQLPQPIFTPTTKAESGHDEPLSHKEVHQLLGPELATTLELKSIEVYKFAQEVARKADIIIADTKMEFGLIKGELCLIDELLTPDSSRFWELKKYSPGSSQVSFDKQFVRDWLVELGWDREPPAPHLPNDVVNKTEEKYHEAHDRLTKANN